MEPQVVQPPLMLTPFDPVEALLADLIGEASMALKQEQGAGHAFWETASTIFLEDRLSSFDTSVSTFKEALTEKKDSLDYAIRFMGRMLLKPYFVEAVGTVHEHFLFGLDMLGFEGKVEEYATDPLIKLMMTFSLHKPIFDELRASIKIKSRPQAAPGRRS